MMPRASTRSGGKNGHPWELQEGVPQVLQGYLNEYARRYNHRHSNESLFHLLITRAAEGVEPARADLCVTVPHSTVLESC